MNDNEIEKALMDYVAQFVDSLKNVGNFAAEQLPDLAQQYLSYATADAVATITISAIAAAVSWYIALYAVPQRDRIGDWTTPKITATVCASITTLGSAIYGLTAVFTLIKVILAPKVFLLEKASALLK